uniref:DUF7912 domain-containing protein n=1 Tax=Kalanchoe fedtschenkoi TaxID=63787 RepID=A0A7N0UB64_KALFE
MASGKFLRSLIHQARRYPLYSSARGSIFASAVDASRAPTSQKHLTSFSSHVMHSVGVSPCKIPPSVVWCHRFSTTFSSGNLEKDLYSQSEVDDDTEEDGEASDGWEDDDETEPEYGDGGAGGGVALQNVPWGERVLSVAREVLLQLGDDMDLYAFKTTPRGYIYARLDKLSNKYGCPDIDELEKYNQEYKKKLDEIGEAGDIPNDLALEVSSPGAERLLKVPDDLDRFKELPMRVCYVEEESKCVEKESIFLLENVDTKSGTCEWKLADVKANNNLTGKGRPLSRKLKDWRLKLPYAMIKKVSLYIE